MLVSRLRSSPASAACRPVSDSEVRLNLRHAPARTSESKDTGKAMILAPLRTRSSQSDLRHGCANFGFAALVADFGIVGHQQLYDSSEPDVRDRTRGSFGANFGFAALGGGSGVSAPGSLK
jgi:hypothetical protein